MEPMPDMGSMFLLFLLQLLTGQVKATRKASCNGWTLTAPAEGSFECNPLGVTISMPGTRCTLFCDDGYRPQHEVLVCSETGGWIPTNSPQCQVDSTMTLVIVLSIVGSILLILGLSVVYARTSKRCRGKRRMLDEDAETGSKRREIQNTSTYYGQVKRLRRKRRLQAERQRKVVELKGRTEDGGEKTATKQLASKRKKETTNFTKTRPRDPRRDKATKGTKDKRREVTRSPRKKLTTSKKGTPRRKVLSAKRNLEKKKPTKKSFQKQLEEFFCFCCTRIDARPSADKTRNGAKVSSVPKDFASRRKKKSAPIPQSSSSSCTTSSSSSSESSSEEEEIPPKKEPRRERDAKTPSSRPAKSPPKRPAPPPKKVPPPRPPAPVFSKRAPRNTSNSTNDSESPKGDATNGKGISSGYSSEGERYRRKRGHSDTTIRKARSKDSDRTAVNSPTRGRAARSHSAAGDSHKKWMEIMSPGPDTEVKETGNPYEHYPAALSYRQYQNFENDYRRTTGDYHPQYSNVKLIPLESVKKPKTETEEEEVHDEKVERSKHVQGGVKYICISEEEGGDEGSDFDEPKSKRNKKKRAERYEDPSARDKRRKGSPDYNDRYSRKHAKKGKKTKHESKSDKDRRVEIGNERIIDAGSGTFARNIIVIEKPPGRKKHKKHPK